ncbi:MAG: tetratricopeptide repeat protein [Verrucomicrobiota bacterium]
MIRTLLSAFCLFVFLGSSAGFAQDQSSAGMSKAAIKAGPAYMSLIRDASEAFIKRDFPAAEKKLDEADQIKPGLFDAICLRASIYAEEREFAKAQENYEKALAIQPNSFLPKFNLAEVLLMQKKFAEAQSAFEQLAAPPRARELVDFKIVLAALGQGNDAKAREVLDHMKFPGDSAAYYYSNAAWEFSHGNKSKAKDWIESGNAIFGQAKNYVFYDSLSDMGWVPARQSPATGEK